MSAMNLTYAQTQYGVIHMATSMMPYASIACGTRYANVCTERTKEVTCLRCRKTDFFLGKRYYEGSR